MSYHVLFPDMRDSFEPLTRQERHSHLNDIEELADYLRHEKALSDQYPNIFAKLIEDYPASLKKRRNKVEPRGENTIIKMLTRLKTIFKYAVDEGYTTNRPFDGFKIGTAVEGTPIYITIEERNIIADCDLEKKWSEADEQYRKDCELPIKTILMCRDVFIFQCFIGCRVGDLIKLTPQHIENGILVYTPHKTKDGKEAVQARVPLHAKADIKDRTGKDDCSLSSLPRSTMMPSRLFSRLLGLRGMLRCLTPSPMSLRYIPLMRLHQVTLPDVLSSVMPTSR